MRLSVAATLMIQLTHLAFFNIKKNLKKIIKKIS